MHKSCTFFCVKHPLYCKMYKMRFVFVTLQLMVIYYDKNMISTVVCGVEFLFCLSIEILIPGYVQNKINSHIMNQFLIAKFTEHFLQNSFCNTPVI